MHCASISCPYFSFTFLCKGTEENKIRGTCQTFSSKDNFPMAIANLCNLQELKSEPEYLKVIFQNQLSSQTLRKGIISMEDESNLKNILVKFMKCKNY